MYRNDVFMVVSTVDLNDPKRISFFEITNVAFKIVEEINEHRRTTRRRWRAFKNEWEARRFLFQVLDGEDRFHFGIKDEYSFRINCGYEKNRM